MTSDSQPPNLFDTVPFAGVKDGDQVIDIGLSTETPVCDFCSADPAVVYFPVEEFEIVHPGLIQGMAVVSGDRFYACGPCAELFEAGKLGGLRRRYTSLQQSAPSDSAVALWLGAKNHRQGDPVTFQPGTNPEQGR
ncbi:hypothetical protein GCM10010404_81270 [Nonomuraea africana]|uniref:Uncharacterized protein n=1 Tax=Nonomuraea africana TaxID=46171 RepID=A0ABR9KWU1_9ACTN|nr:hypothetical protein [Nonomuraea africana]MBE1566495.1 hypothetical protein [Nonomuraea africana]